MDIFFHAETRRYAKLRKRLLALIIAPMTQLAIIAVMALILNSRGLSDPEFYRPLLWAVSITIIVMLFSVWFVAARTERMIKRHSRYTYLDLGVKAMVFSRYAGEYINYGTRFIMRELAVVSYEDITELEEDAKSGAVTVSGKARFYFGEADSLGYHFRKGEVEFDRFLYNYRGFDSRDKIVITKSRLDKQSLLFDAINEAKKRCDELPPPQPYKFKEADFIRRRPKPRPLPEGMSFDRKW